MRIVIKDSMISYGSPRGNESMGHIFSMLIEQSMLSNEYCLGNSQMSTHSYRYNTLSSENKISF